MNAQGTHQELCQGVCEWAQGAEVVRGCKLVEGQVKASEQRGTVQMGQGRELVVAHQQHLYIKTHHSHTMI